MIHTYSYYIYILYVYSDYSVKGFCKCKLCKLDRIWTHLQEKWKLLKVFHQAVLQKVMTQWCTIGNRMVWITFRFNCERILKPVFWCSSWIFSSEIEKCLAMQAGHALSIPTSQADYETHMCRPNCKRVGIKSLQVRWRAKSITALQVLGVQSFSLSAKNALCNWYVWSRLINIRSSNYHWSRRRSIWYRVHSVGQNPESLIENGLCLYPPIFRSVKFLCQNLKA